MLPDTGERYLSTPLFEDIPVEMTSEETEIAKSTPGFRFDVKPPPVPAKPAEEPSSPPSAKAVAFVSEVTTDPKQPVVMFAFEWCEFCWSVRKLFKAFGIPFRSVDLDSAEYQKENWGGQIRIALRERANAPTIPQIFIGGEHIGGCTETFDAFNDGRLQWLLRDRGIEVEQPGKADAYSFLPKWLHPR
jgi:cysteine synthase A